MRKFIAEICRIIWLNAKLSFDNAEPVGFVIDKRDPDSE